VTCHVRGSLRLPNNTQSPSSNLRTLPVTVQTTTDGLASILSLIHHCTTVVYFLGLDRYQYQVSSDTYSSIGTDTSSSFTVYLSQQSTLGAFHWYIRRSCKILEWSEICAAAWVASYCCSYFRNDWSTARWSLDWCRSNTKPVLCDDSSPCFLVKHNSD